MDIFGIRLVGINVENGEKLLLTVLFIAAAILARMAVLAVLRATIGPEHERVAFWIRQGISLFIAVVIIIGVLSIWFDDPTRLTTAAGL